MKLNSVVGFTVIVILYLSLVQSYQNSLEKSNENALSKPRKQKSSYQNSLEKSNGNALSKPRKLKGRRL